jgi:serine/threonine protein kinase
VIREALFWKRLNQPYILPFLGISQDAIAPHLCLVSPWMTHGNILDFIDESPEADRLSLVCACCKPAATFLSKHQIAQCSHGLRYLHDYHPGLVHGNIKGVSAFLRHHLRLILYAQVENHSH